MQNAEEFLTPETEELTLPSGLKVTVRPPNKLEFFAVMGWLPGQLAALAAGEKPPVPSPGELVEKTYQFIVSLVISPRFAVPDPDQPPGTYNPRRLRDADRLAIEKWAGKYLELGGGGGGLSGFRAQESATAPPSGASSGDVSPTPQRTPAWQPARLGD
jgi:hypothetical protein